MSYDPPKFPWLPSSLTDLIDILFLINGIRTDRLLVLKKKLENWKANETLRMMQVGSPDNFNHDWTESPRPVVDRKTTQRVTFLIKAIEDLYFARLAGDDFSKHYRHKMYMPLAIMLEHDGELKDLDI